MILINCKTIDLWATKFWWRMCPQAYLLKTDHHELARVHFPPGPLVFPISGRSQRTVSISKFELMCTPFEINLKKKVCTKVTLPEAHSIFWTCFQDLPLDYLSMPLPLFLPVEVWKGSYNRAIFRGRICEVSCVPMSEYLFLEENSVLPMYFLVVSKTAQRLWASTKVSSLQRGLIQPP